MLPTQHGSTYIEIQGRLPEKHEKSNIYILYIYLHLFGNIYSQHKLTKFDNCSCNSFLVRPLWTEACINIKQVQSLLPWRCVTCHMAFSFRLLLRAATTTLCSTELLLAALFHATSCTATTLWSSPRTSVSLPSPFAATPIYWQPFSTWQVTWKLWHRLCQKSIFS